MTDALLVLLDRSIIGSVFRLNGGRLRFDYADDYRDSAGATPLSLSMPTQVRSHPHSAITPWLWGLLPDNDLILTRWARQFHVSRSSPFSLLSTPIGRDCAGAVQFVSVDHGDDPLTTSGNVTWLSEDDLAERLRDLRRDSTAWLGTRFAGQFSLAGAQAKTALIFRDERWGVPSGSTPTTHILKPAVTGLDDHDLNEHLCLDAARRAGLVAARTRVVRFGDESAVIVDRYDRQQQGTELVRVHQEDLCQALGVSPAAKYENEGGPGTATIARLLREAMPPRVADDALRRFADALIWNWLIAGTDAHAKNYSVLLANDQVRLAPLYDVASALPYGTHERKLRLAMKVGGDYRVVLSRNTWPAAAKDLGLDPDALQDRILELGARAPDAFAEAANEPDIVALGRPMPGRLVDLVADRAARCSRLIGARGTAD